MKRILLVGMLGLAAGWLESRANETLAQQPASTQGAATQTADALREAVLRARDQCLAYVGPSEQPIYSEEPELVEAQRSKGNAYQYVEVVSPVKYAFVQAPVKLLNDLEQALQRLHPKFARLFPPNAQPVVHGLTSPTGERFLVTMALIATVEEPKMRFAAVTLSLPTVAPEAANIFKQVVEVPVAYNGRTANKPLQVYSAVFDQKDPAAFTIRYTSGGEKGALRGRMNLEDQFPKLLVEVADGPLKPQ